MYYCGFTYTEAYNIPVTYKKWFIERLAKEFKRGKEDDSAPPTRAAHLDTPEMREFAGRSRAEVPSRLRRFT